MIVSAVIPTRNRPDDLLRAVESVYRQTRFPDELLIIDQSDTNKSKDVIIPLYAKNTAIHLIYIHDKAIPGLVAAKDLAVKRSHGAIVMFLEDDVVLENDYVANLLQGFLDHPEMMGSCGIVTKVPNVHPLYQWIFHVFHRGIFYDARVGIYGNENLSRQRMISSNYLSGGLSAYRRLVFEKVPFDTKNQLFMLEDIDFSTRATRIFGKDKFFINANARLEHHLSSGNRATLGPRYSRKLREYVIFYKKHRERPWDFFSFLWLLMGNLLKAGFESIKSRQRGPLFGFVHGVTQGILWRIQ